MTFFLRVQREHWNILRSREKGLKMLSLVLWKIWNKNKHLSCGQTNTFFFSIDGNLFVHFVFSISSVILLLETFLNPETLTGEAEWLKIFRRWSEFELKTRTNICQKNNINSRWLPNTQIFVLVFITNSLHFNAMKLGFNSNPNPKKTRQDVLLQSMYLLLRVFIYFCWFVSVLNVMIQFSKWVKFKLSRGHWCG